MPQISVIVPVYKVEAYLCRCVDSILKQTYTDFELILVDDGSPDNCGMICDDYAAMDSRVKVIHKVNGGVSSARNLGLDVAEGEYITFVDSDDWLHPKMLELLYGTLCNYNSKMSICAFQSVYEYIEIPEIAATAVELLDPEELYVSLNVNAIAPWAKLIHKSLLESIRFPLGVRFEDERTMYKALFQVEKVPFVNVPLYFYFSNPTGFMNTCNGVVRMDAIPAYEEPLRFFEEHGYIKAFNDKIITYFQWLTQMIPMVALFSPGGCKTKVQLHKTRLHVFLRMNFAQRARVCDELHPRLMGVYWRIRSVMHMVFQGSWKELFIKVQRKIRK